MADADSTKTNKRRENRVIVGLADYKVCRAPVVLATLSLGSCIGVTLYEKSQKIGGLAHIMLPDSSIHSSNSMPNKFADTAIPAMLDNLVKAGAKQTLIKAKIFGGANMFSGIMTHRILDIGAKNVMATKNILYGLHIPIVAEDTGENFGRSIEIDLETGRVLRKSYTKGNKYF